MHDTTLRSLVAAATPDATATADDTRILTSASPITWPELAVLQSLLWLVVGCVAGMALATLLLAPDTGTLFGAVTYGRIVPVHFNTQLYGWLSIPFVGLLLGFYFPSDRHPAAVIALNAWSGGLAWSVATWLAGHSSGKLFLEFTGSARVIMTVAMATLWLSLLVGLASNRGAWTRPMLAARAAIAAVLAPVPWVMWRATSAEIYPPINPDSGGATGGSLLGSTLGIIVVMLLVPFLARRTLIASSKRAVVRISAALAVHSLLFGLLDHGDHSHHEAVQIVAILSLGVWIPLLARFFRSFEWDETQWLWLRALAGWGTFLWITATITFMPGVLERLKFTNSLVAHSHLAMAGFTTSLVVLVLATLADETRLGKVFADGDAFRDWHVGLILMIVSLTILGVLESERQGLLFTHHPASTTLYLVRWLAGLLMLLAAIRWGANAIRAVEAGE